MSKEAEGPETEPTLFLFTLTDGNAALILSMEAMRQIKNGGIVIAPIGPGKNLVVSCSHDIEESASQLNMMTRYTDGMIDKELLGFIIREGARPPKRKRKKNGDNKSTA